MSSNTTNDDIMNAMNIRFDALGAFSYQNFNKLNSNIEDIKNSQNKTNMYCKYMFSILVLAFFLVLLLFFLYKHRIFL